MPKKKQKPSVADQFSDEEMGQIGHMGRMMSGGVTPFDEEVEKHLNRREAEEANASKMRAAQTGAPEAAAQGLGPSEMDQAQVKQRGAIYQQSDTQAAQQAAQAQGAQQPVNAPAAPSGPAGTTTTVPAQQGDVGGGGNLQQPAAQENQPPPPAPDGQPPDQGDQGPPQ